MIASPGDVAEEREIIRSVIHDWNDVNATVSKIVLTPVGWETHSSPELGARAQDLINSRLLNPCDLLVGVFWTRLGTPTGETKSGTVEEIEKHLASGKPAMIYFSSKPVAPESIDAAQFAEVTSFKTRCKERGLIEFFDDAGQFREKFAKQLQLTLIQNEYLRRVAAPPEANASVIEAASSTPTARLSEEAGALLKAASKKNDGAILKIAYMGGRVIQAGGETFGGGRGRESALWEDALDQLINERLVVARGYKGEVFELTHAGWAAADAL
jgi:hypothetical protein